MRRWVTIGALILVGLWGPFLYRELTSERVQKKNGAVLADDADQAPAEPQELAAGDEAPAAGGEGADEAKAQVPPPAESEQAPAEPSPAEAPAQAEQVPTGDAPPTPGPAEPGDDKPAPAEGVEGMPEAEAVELPPAPSSTTVFEHVFESEPRDALWAREAEARLLQVMAGAEVPLDTIKSARCQKTVCRLELLWKPEDSTAYSAALTSVRGEFGADLGVKNLGPGENEGEQRIDLYVPRQGYTLADLQR